MGGLAPASNRAGSTADLARTRPFYLLKEGGRMNRRSFTVGLKAIGLCNFEQPLNAPSRGKINCAILRAKNEPKSIAKIHQEKIDRKRPSISVRFGRNSDG